MRFSLAVCTLLFGAVLLADAALSQVDFGIRGGLNVSTFSGDDAEDSEAKLGALGGLFLNYAFSPALSVQPEVLFSQKGAQFDDEGDVLSLRINYIDVPVLVKYTIPTATGLLPSLYAGPQFSFKLSEALSDGVEVDDFELIKSTDFGFAVGADVGTRLAGRTQQFGVGLRYSLSLTNILDLDFGDPDLKNSVFAVSAYFGF
jgi:hypothetical protein